MTTRQTNFPHERHPEIEAEPARTLAREARLAAIAAEHAMSMGTLDPAEALRLRDDALVASSAMRVRERELLALFAKKAGS